MINSTGATPLTSKDESLVAGNVTGGGGKATKKRPNGIGRESVQTKRVINLGADRDRLSAEEASGYKIGGSNVYMREPPNSLPGHFGEWIKKNKSVETSNRDDAFVLFKS